MGRRFYVAIALLLCGAHSYEGVALVPEGLNATRDLGERPPGASDNTTTIEKDEEHLRVNETVTENYEEYLIPNLNKTQAENAEEHTNSNETLESNAEDRPNDTTVTAISEEHLHGDVNETMATEEHPMANINATTVEEYPHTNVTAEEDHSNHVESERRPKQAEAGGGRRSGAPCPCDEDFGLRCSPDTNTCQGPLSVEVSEVGARSARVRWRSSAGLEPQAQVSLAPAHGTWTKISGGGGAGGVQLGGMTPGRAYWVRVEEDGRHEAAQFTTAHEPKVLVRALGPSSLTVAWDDFRPPSPTSRYVLLYRRDDEWKQVQAGSRTMVSLSGLAPDTAYEVRVAAWEDGRQVDASEQVTARTEDGCVWEGRSLAVGEEWLEEGDCGDRCACAGSNSTRCAPRCAAPFFRRTGGAPLHDPSCYEAPAPNDPTCCAALRCPETKFYGDEKTRGSHNKSGECPDLVSDSSCLSDCDRDADCADDLKCCPSACGGALCVPPAARPCDHVVCGPNAECEAGACACDHGFGGDPRELDHGCQPISDATEAPFHLDLASEEENFHLNDTGRTALSDGCVFGNASFLRGAHFEAGCEARCVCEGRGRVTCAPRCRRTGEAAPGCALRPDPDDPDCCTLAVCAFPGVRVVSAEALSGTSVRVRVDPPSSAVSTWVRGGAGGEEWRPVGGGDTGRDGSLDVEGLAPATDYELHVTVRNASSNTVHVKTLPAGSSSGACVHEGRPLALGETLEVGCEHRCVCREGGVLECRDRCQVWVDAVGMEGCEWAPAPDDPCCTVPLCPPPGLLPFPSGGGGGGARCEGEGGISYRAGDIWESDDGCRTTICRCGARGVQCTSECPPSPPRCPGPLVTTPECACPVCATEHQPATTAPASPAPRRCEFRGALHAVDAEFLDGCAARCVCGSDLRVTCTPLECSPPPAGCLEWDEDPCCPKCKESVGAWCESEGGAPRRPSERWEEGERQCECLRVEGGARALCCPRVPPRFLAPTDRCPRPVVVTPDDPQMCPYVVCNNTAHGGADPEEVEQEEVEELRGVSVVALNATAVRVRFSLPPGLVGARGHAELRFSPDPALPPSAWRAQRFSRPRRLFDSPHIEYVLAGHLLPDTAYYMRVRVRPDPPLPPPRDSALFKVTMPPPAAVTLDVRPLRAQPLPGGRGARVSWRPFPPRERRLVDALRLQWRMEGGSGEWQSTPPLHRDVSEWELRDLRPSSLYELRLLLRGEEGAPAVEAAPGNTLHFATNATEETLVARVVRVSWDRASLSLSSKEEGARVVRVRWGSAAGDAPRSSFLAPPFNASQPAILEGLTPNSKYWAQLDLYLDDGRTLTSNRMEFQTENVEASENVVSQESRSDGNGGGSLGALVAVAVVCGAAALAFALLLVVVVRRGRGAEAPISRTPSEAAYDNPTYKTYDGETTKPEDPSQREK